MAARSISGGTRTILPALNLARAKKGVRMSDPQLVQRASVRALEATVSLDNRRRVHELEVEVIDPKAAHVATVDVTVHVPDLTGKPTDVTLQIVKQPSTSPVDLQITRVPKEPVVLYNAYGNNKGHYFDLKIEDHKKLQEIFYDIKQHCLDSGKIPGDATGFTISWSKRAAWFYDPAINHTRVLDLDKIMKSNPEINDVVIEAEELISEGVNKGCIRNYNIDPNNKGAFDGAAPLYRSNQVLQALPKSTGDQAYKAAMSLSYVVLTDDTQRDAAIHRMGKAERIIKKMKDKVVQEKATLVPLYTAAQDPAERARLQKSIEELTALEERLNNIDTFALYSALAFYPPGADPSPEEVYRRAQMLQKQVVDQLEQERQQAIADGTKKSWIPKWVPLINRFRDEPKIEESRFYPIDVAGLMFSGLEFPEARCRYVDFCRGNNVPCKGDGLEDALIREVLCPGSTAHGKNPALEELLDDVTDPTLKGTLAAEMQGAITSAQTSAPLTLNGADPSARIDDFRRQAALETEII